MKPSNTPTVSIDANYEILHAIFLEPRRIRGDFVRPRSVEFAALCSMGLITTNEGGNLFGQYYRLTPAGMALMISLEEEVNE